MRSTLATLGKKKTDFTWGAAVLLGEFFSTLKENPVGQTRVLMEEAERRVWILVPWKYSAEVLGGPVRRWI